MGLYVYMHTVYMAIKAKRVLNTMRKVCVALLTGPCPAFVAYRTYFSFAYGRNKVKVYVSGQWMNS